MFETKIKFQGKERTIKFGAWVNGNIEKIVNKKDYGNMELLASVIFFGLVMGEKLRQVTRLMKNYPLIFSIAMTGLMSKVVLSQKR